jgi:hypothetical protein
MIGPMGVQIGPGASFGGYPPPEFPFPWVRLFSWLPHQTRTGWIWLEFGWRQAQGWDCYDWLTQQGYADAVFAGEVKG